MPQWDKDARKEKPPSPKLHNSSGKELEQSGAEQGDAHEGRRTFGQGLDLAVWVFCP